MTPRPLGRPTANPAVAGSIRVSNRSSTAITAASGELSRVAGRHSSGPGISGGAGARCTGSARSSVPNVPVIRTRSCGRPSSPGCTTRISAVDTVRPTRSTSTRTSTGPAGAADRKWAPQVSRSGCPTEASPDAAADAPSAISTPPLIACPISQPSPRWPRATPTAPASDGPDVAPPSHVTDSTSSNSLTAVSSCPRPDAPGPVRPRRPPSPVSRPSLW